MFHVKHPLFRYKTVFLATLIYFCFMVIDLQLSTYTTAYIITSVTLFFTITFYLLPSKTEGPPIKSAGLLFWMWGVKEKDMGCI